MPHSFFHVHDLKYINTKILFWKKLYKFNTEVIFLYNYYQNHMFE